MCAILVAALSTVQVVRVTGSHSAYESSAAVVHVVSASLYPWDFDLDWLQKVAWQNKNQTYLFIIKSYTEYNKYIKEKI